MVDAQLVHYKARVRLMFYRPSMVDAQLVYYKAYVRLMSYRLSMVDAQLVHYKSQVRLMSYQPSMVDALRSQGKETLEGGQLNLVYRCVHPDLIDVLLKVYLCLPDKMN